MVVWPTGRIALTGKLACRGVPKLPDRSARTGAAARSCQAVRYHAKARNKSMTRQRKVFSNFERFSSVVAAEAEGEYVDLNDPLGNWSAWKLIREVRSGDVVILNIDHQRLYQLCLLRLLFFWKSFRLVSVDILLRRPTRLSRKLMRWLQVFLLKRVDLFILYFRDTRDYQRLFGLRPERIRYVPFKVNGWEEGLEDYQADPTTGDYVICAGQTLRDLNTFCEACRLAEVPGVLLSPGNQLFQRHGTQLDSHKLPPNVRLEVHSDGNDETFLDWLKQAAIVVIPRFANDISSTGISTYLTSMAASRCVVLSRGPGAEDVLTEGQAVLVEPEDPQQLANELRTLWNDPEKRAAVARRGRAYAERVQGESRLLHDVLKTALEG